MNSLPKLFIGAFLIFLFAWGGLVAMPYIQIGRLQPQVDEDTQEQFPPARSGLAERGAKVFAANGCVYCHTQQVRSDFHATLGITEAPLLAYAKSRGIKPEDFGSDLARGWGARQTVPRDYIRDHPTFLGTMRTGPDLSNIGARQPSILWHYQHLFRPNAMTKGSIMPPFRFLFKVQPVKGQPSTDAFTVPGDTSVPPGFEIVPTDDAKALVEYLLSLKRNYSLKEAPVD